MPLALRDQVLQPPQQRCSVKMAGTVGSRSAYGGSRGIMINIRFPDDTEKVLSEAGVCLCGVVACMSYAWERA